MRPFRQTSGDVEAKLIISSSWKALVAEFGRLFRTASATESTRSAAARDRKWKLPPAAAASSWCWEALQVHQQVHFLWPPLSYRNEQTLLGASSQPLRATDRLPSPDAARPPRASAGQQPRRALGGTLVRSELRSRPPARLLSCGAVTAPTPHTGKRPEAISCPAARPAPLCAPTAAPGAARPRPPERPPPAAGPRALHSSGNRPPCPPAPVVRETKGDDGPPLKQRNRPKQGTAAPRSRDGMGGRPDGGNGPAAPAALRPHRTEGAEGATAAGGAPYPYPIPRSRRSGRSRRPSAAPAAASCCGRGPSPPRSAAGGARPEARPRQAEGGTGAGPNAAARSVPSRRPSGPPRLRTRAQGLRRREPATAGAASTGQEPQRAASSPAATVLAAVLIASEVSVIAQPRTEHTSCPQRTSLFLVWESIAKAPVFREPTGGTPFFPSAPASSFLESDFFLAQQRQESSLQPLVA